jgi:hypothetical protein
MADLAPDTAAASPAPPAPSPTPVTPATPSPAAAPAPSAPKSIADETAAVFRAAREKAAPAGSSPAEPDGTAPAQAARVPAAAGEAIPPVRGPIPYDRHEAVLTRARREAREEAEKELRGKLGWAERFDPQETEQGVALARWLKADPKSAIDFLTRQLPTSAPTAPEKPAMPEPDITLGDGQQFYSAAQAQKLLEWRDEQLETRINGRFGPMLQEAALSKLNAQATTEATQLRQYYHTNFPMFKELEGDIKALCLQHPQLSIEHAYTLVFRDKGLAKQREAWESERAGQLARKAAASSVPPGAAQPGTPRPNSAKSTIEITREVFARKRAAAG